MGEYPPYDGPGWDANSDDPLSIIFPHENVTLLSWITVPEFGSQHTSANDCWGYTAPSGREYALIGLSHGLAFVDVTEPTLPEIVTVKDGPVSLWRDMKVYEQYAYAVSEAGGGIQVFDMSNIDNGEVTALSNVTEGGSLPTTATHNVALNEESGHLYRCGGGGGTIGLRIYSLENPASPQFGGEWHDFYVHDAQVVTWEEGEYAGREIAFCNTNSTSSGGSPGLHILDVTDKSNIVVIGQTSYSLAAFSHQGWLTEDRQHFLLGDELAELSFGIPTTTRVIDVSDLSNPFEATTFTNSNTSIGHNISTRGNLSFHANYRSGLRVFDVSDPVNVEEVGSFNTWPGDNNAMFNGLWGNFPYFPSGIVIGSDIEKGLFVWRIDLDVDETPGDLTGDGTVGVDDLLILLNNWGPCGDPDDCPADITGNGVVNVDDMLILLNNWG